MRFVRAAVPEEPLARSKLNEDPVTAAAKRRAGRNENIYVQAAVLYEKRDLMNGRTMSAKFIRTAKPLLFSSLAVVLIPSVVHT